MTWQLWVTLGAIALVCLAWLGAAGLLLWAVLDPDDFQTIVDALGGKWGLLFFLWAVSLVPIYSALQWAMTRYLVAPERLADAIDLRRKQHLNSPIETTGIAAIDRLAALFNAQMAAVRELNEDVNARVEAAVAQTEQERAWLSALLAELNRSVIVCNRDGQILLYNNRARLQFKRLSDAGDVTHGGELLGLGRSIYGVIDKALIEHAKDTIERRLGKGERQTTAQCLMQTDSGRTYRIHITPVCRDSFVETQTIDGMILVIENITDEVQNKQQHSQALLGFAHEADAQTKQLDQIHALIESEANEGEHTHQIIDALARHRQWLKDLSASLSAIPNRTLRPYPLEDLSAEDWLEALMQALPSSVETTLTLAPGLETVWLRVDGLSLIRAQVALIMAVVQHHGPQAIEIAGHMEGEVLVVTTQWPMRDQSHDDLAAWFATTVAATHCGQNVVGQSIAEVVAYHGGHCALCQDPTTLEHAKAELKLPTIPALDTLPEALAQRHEGRPEYYDFQLFDLAIGDTPLGDQALAQLSYTVFDTETTGLNPSRGDEIIQIGAVRVVNGRILNKEHFDQLVDPKRPIPASSIAIHGIQPEDVQGAPDIETVLPVFHRFCQDTVLVAHNADFDMQCLSLKAPLCGIAFDHPVLDTLLLSALAHPFQESHNLDQVAMRLGIEINDRHRALGDAKMTAQTLIRLLPILQERGITTLHQALEAQRSVWQRRASY